MPVSLPPDTLPSDTRVVTVLFCSPTLVVRTSSILNFGVDDELSGSNPFVRSESVPGNALVGTAR